VTIICVIIAWTVPIQGLVGLSGITFYLYVVNLSSWSGPVSVWDALRHVVPKLVVNHVYGYLLGMNLDFVGDVAGIFVGLFCLQIGPWKDVETTDFNARNLQNAESCLGTFSDNGEVASSRVAQDESAAEIIRLPPSTAHASQSASVQHFPQPKLVVASRAAKKDAYSPPPLGQFKSTAAAVPNVITISESRHRRDERHQNSQRPQPSAVIKGAKVDLVNTSHAISELETMRQKRLNHFENPAQKKQKKRQLSEDVNDASAGSGETKRMRRSIE
jgi:hypothetical protein